MRFLRSPLAASVLLSLIVSSGIVALRTLGALESLELAAYDWFIRSRPSESKPDSRIALVTISERDIQNQGKWPLPDATLARALEVLARFRPRAVGVDIYRDVTVPPGREKLASLLASDRRIIGVMKFGETSLDGVAPHPALKAADRVGFNDIIVDPGGIVRRGLLFLDDGSTTAYSFALRLALLYLQSHGIAPQPDPKEPQQIRLGKSTLKPFESNDGAYSGADARGYQFLLDYRGVNKSFAYVSLTDLLSGAGNEELLRDKIVLIGVTAESVKDNFYTPYSPALSDNQHTPGLVIHAYIVDQLLRAGLEGALPIHTIAEWQETIWILLWGVTGGLMGLVLRSPAPFTAALVGGLFAVAGFDFLVFLKGWWFPLVPAGLAWSASCGVVTAYMSYEQMVQRAALMQLFSRHVSKEVAEAIWQQRDQFLDGRRPRPQRLVASVLFTDLAAFTAVAEKLRPDALMDWLNEYMEPMAQHVSRYGGVIEQYSGDSIVAIFGVPVARSSEDEIAQDAVNAVNCALAMAATLSELNARWRTADRPTTGMRIGIFTGPMVAGALGSAERSEYVVIGDTVNIASRLETLSKEVKEAKTGNSPCRILIGEATLRYLGNQFRTESVGEVVLKGKEERITVYRVIGRSESGTAVDGKKWESVNRLLSTS